MKKSKKTVVGLSLTLYAVLLNLMLNALDVNIPVFIYVLIGLCTIIGIILMIAGSDKKGKVGSGGNKQKTDSSTNVKKMRRRIASETDMDALCKIASNNPVPELRQLAEERKLILYRELFQGKHGLDAQRKAVHNLVFDYGVDSEKAAYLEMAEEDCPELVYSMVKEAFGAAVRSSYGFNERLPFLLKISKKYPEILRQYWPKMSGWAHEDNSHHEDKPGGFHTDNTQYYDWIRYPNGRTVPKRDGRKRHTDTRGSYSDCHEDHHQDAAKHTDNAHEERLVPFKPYIRADED